MQTERRQLGRRPRLLSASGDRGRIEVWPSGAAKHRAVAVAAGDPCERRVVRRRPVARLSPPRLAEPAPGDRRGASRTDFSTSTTINRPGFGKLKNASTAQFTPRMSGPTRYRTRTFSRAWVALNTS